MVLFFIVVLFPSSRCGEQRKQTLVLHPSADCIRFLAERGATRNVLDNRFSFLGWQILTHNKQANMTSGEEVV